jgi:kynurenine formamidase
VQPIADGLPSYAELLARTDAPPGSIWGLFGADDELGACNLLGDAEVRRGLACARRGLVFSLDHPIGAFDSPHRPPAQHTILDLGRGWRDDYLDTYYLQQTSQIDGLRHVAHREHGFYNGADASRLVPGDPLLGVNRWADRGIAGRGVLVDVARHLERHGRRVRHAPGEPISAALIDEVLAEQGTALERGDLLVLHTDYLAHRIAHPGVRGHAGLEQSREMLAWLWDHRIPLVASDTVATECSPPVASSPFTPPDPLDASDSLMHGELIALLGMVIGELWNLTALAEHCASDGRYDFFLVVKPLDLVGGVGSPPNATAIV